MKKTLKNILISVISLGVIGLLTSCPNPNGSYPESTNWLFVNQSEVDKLLNSPENIEFEGKKYKLEIYFDNDVTRGKRGPFMHPSIDIKRRFRFFIQYSDNNVNMPDNNKLKATNLWIINTYKEFYFKVNNLSSSDKLNGIVDAPKNYTFTVNNSEILGDSGVAIMRFETKEKEYFIKTSKILKGQKL